MDWIMVILSLVMSSGSILIVLYMLKRALDWAEWKGKTDTSIGSLEITLNEIKENVKAMQDDIKRIIRALPD